MYDSIDQKISNKDAKICDVGCGLGRYLKKFRKAFPNYSFFGVDPLCSSKWDHDSLGITVCDGTCTNIPYEDKAFDFTYACESLEHAIDISSSIKELARVTKTNGYIAILDKNAKYQGTLKVDEWEQWFDEEYLKNLILEFCSEVHVRNGISHDDNDNDKIFILWIGKVL